MKQTIPGILLYLCLAKNNLFNFGSVPKPHPAADFANLNTRPGVRRSCTMTGAGSFFAENYQKVAEKLTQEHYENFKYTDSDFDRIEILYPYCKDMITESANSYGKDYEQALQQKSAGNSHFAKHEVNKALDCYSAGIIKCPQCPGESVELVAVLIANRSACLFELREYEKTLADIEYALSIGSYPEGLKYKLFMRKAKCYSNIQNKKHLASDAYKMAIDCITLSKLDKEVVTVKKLEIAKALQELKTCTPPPPTTSKPSLKPFASNASFINATEAIRFDQEDSLGNFALAAKHIECGTIIIDEPAYCAVVAEEFTLTNCQHCMLATDTPIACQTCANVVFCSLKCQEKAASYHRFECGLHPTLFSSGASINCYMALRIITQRSTNFFKEISEERSNKRCITKYLCEKSHDYYGVYRLCRNEEKRRIEEYVQYTLIAIYLLRLLKTTSYFNIQSDSDDALTVMEIFIGSLILRNLQALQFNAHEISELREAPPGPLDPKDEPNFKAVYVGGGLYTTLALFNHSCDPSIVRYNVGSKMVVKTIKPIKQGEMVYENYGPIYTNSPREERRKFLFERYWFECKCQACEENWPQFKDMVESEVKISCVNKNCNNFFYLHNNLDCPAIKCSECNKVTNLFPLLTALSKLEDILPRAEELYKRQNYEEATKLYLNAMKIYFKNTVPPFPDWVKVQQRLRTCFISEGNKSITYSKVRGDK